MLEIVERVSFKPSKFKVRCGGCGGEYLRSGYRSGVLKSSSCYSCAGRKRAKNKVGLFSKPQYGAAS